LFQNLEALAKQCRARSGSVGVWIEDKASGSILLQQARNRGWNANVIESTLTAAGKDERAISISSYHYPGLVSWSGNGRLKAGIIRSWPIRPHSVLALRSRRPRWCGLRCHGSGRRLAGMPSVNLPEASLGPAALPLMDPS
jgi:hypothetical protein